MNILNKWITIIQEDLNRFKSTKELYAKLSPALESGVLIMEEVCEGGGVIGCFIMEDIYGDLVCHELIVYLKPENRGTPSTLSSMINRIEEIAKENGCSKVQLGSSLGYNDSGIIKVYKSLGYKTTGVSKDV